jgi:hypothetical protein
VLEPFGQIENIFTRTHGGTGLGLPLAKMLAALHGGRLSIQLASTAATENNRRPPAFRGEPCG